MTIVYIHMLAANLIIASFKMKNFESMTTKSICYLIFALLIISSCIKKDDPEAPMINVSKHGLLTFLVMSFHQPGIGNG
jgi:hypothetical protein